MESIKPEYGFKVINNADSVEYKVNQSSLGFGTGCLALVAGPFILWIPIVLFIYVLHKLGIHINTNSDFYVYTMIFVNIGLPIGYIIYENYKRKTIPQRVIMTNKTITVIDRKKERQYDFSHISDITLGNSSLNISNTCPIDNGIIIGGTGITGIAAVGVGFATSTVKGAIDTAAAAAKAEAAERGWSISIRYGSKDVILFSSLTKNIGESLFQHMCTEINKLNC